MFPQRLQEIPWEHKQIMLIRKKETMMVCTSSRNGWRDRQLVESRMTVGESDKIQTPHG